MTWQRVTRWRAFVRERAELHASGVFNHFAGILSDAMPVMLRNRGLNRYDRRRLLKLYDTTFIRTRKQRERERRR